MIHSALSTSGKLTWKTKNEQSHYFLKLNHELKTIFFCQTVECWDLSCLEGRLLGDSNLSIDAAGFCLNYWQLATLQLFCCWFPRRRKMAVRINSTCVLILNRINSALSLTTHWIWNVVPSMSVDISLGDRTVNRCSG